MALYIQLSWGENTAFAIRPQFPSSQKHVSFLFQSCVRKHEGHTVPLHEKRCQVRVFCVCWLPYLLLPWLVETVMSDDFPARMATACFFMKTQMFDKMCCFNEKKNEPVCFLGRFEAATIQLLQRENRLAIRSQFPGSQKHVCLSFTAV